MRRVKTKHLLSGAALIALTLVFVPTPFPSSSLSATPALPPASAEADLAAGINDIDLERYAKATQRLTRAIGSGALSGTALALAYHHRGIAQQKLGFPAAAIDDYTRVIALNVLPKEVLARTYYNRGLANFGIGDRIAAERDYSQAIDLEPGYAAAYHNRANLERARRDYPTAIRDYGIAIDRLDGEKRKFPLMGRALAREKSGDVDGAIADVDQALALDPGYRPALTKRAELVALKGEWGASAMRADKDAPPEAADKAQNASSLRTSDATPGPANESGPPAATAPPKSAGRYRLQLGSFRARDLAAKAWAEISGQQTPMASLDHSIEEADLGPRGTFYRLRAGAFDKASEAKAHCAALANQRIKCIVVAY